MQPKVSIVVPMYNVEQYIKKCINSLLEQTLYNIEVVLVDDGSPDRCGEIADNYSLRDNRVKVVHQMNGGLGPARNAGVEVASGEYIAFVDGDDWVKSDMYEKLYAIAKKDCADIVVSGHCDVVNGVAVVKKVHPLAGQTLNTVENIKKIRKNLFGHAPRDKIVEAFPMSVCMSIYKRSLFKNHELRFQKILSEDTIFNLSAYKIAKVISFTPDTDYCYRKEEQNSITHSFSRDKLLIYQEFLQVLEKRAEEEKDTECILRTKKMAIDYCRLYVGIVDNSQESFSKKKMYVKEFAEKEDIKKFWANYPIDKLPSQQKIFHSMIEHKWYGMTLILNRLRQLSKSRRS